MYDEQSRLLAEALNLRLAAPQATGAPAVIAASVNDTLADTIRQIINSAISPIRQTLSAVQSSVSGLAANLTTALTNAVRELVRGIGESIAAAMGEVYATVSDVIGGVIGGIERLYVMASQALSTVVAYIRQQFGALIEGLRGVYETIADNISGALRYVVGELTSRFTELVNGVLSTIRDFFSTAVERVEGVITAVRGAISDAVSSIRGWIERSADVVRGYITDVINWLRQLIAELSAKLAEIRRELAAWLAREVAPRLDNLIDGAKSITDTAVAAWEAIQAGDYQRAFDIVDNFFKGLGIPAPLRMIHAIVSTAAWFWLSVELQFVPLQVAAQHQAQLALQASPIPIELAARAYYLGAMTRDEYYRNAYLAGMPRERADTALQAAVSLLTPTQVAEAYLRGLLDEAGHDTYLRSMGYRDNDIEAVKALYWLIPPPSDLIRMAVREVFTPEVAERFGQFEDFPEAFVAWAKRQGISEEWARAYWAAHWDLPSPTMGFEMLHRGIIDENELKLLLRALDIMPYWRDKLIQLSYNPVTRVDLRRMYQMGVIDRDRVYRGYLDLGYKPDDAQALTEFTIRYSSPEDGSELAEIRQLTRSVYSQAYRRRVISRDEYITLLQRLGYVSTDAELLASLDDYAIADNERVFDINAYRRDYSRLVLSANLKGILDDNETLNILQSLGYTETEASMEMALNDYERGLKTRDVVLARLRDAYQARLVTDTDVQVAMSGMGFSQPEIDASLTDWQLETIYPSRIPPLTDIRRMYNEGLITRDDVISALEAQGYPEKYVQAYLGLWKI